MNSFASAVVSAAKPTLKDFGDEAVEMGSKLMRPMESEFEKSEGGKFLLGLIKNDYQPMYHKTLADLTNAAKASGSKESPMSIANKARNIAREQAFGHNDALAVGAVKAAYLEKGQIHAQNLSDHLAMYLHDTESKPVVYGKHVKTQYSNVSGFKMNVVKSIRKNDPLYQGLKIDPKAVWHPRTKIERDLQSYAAMNLAPAIAIPHLETPLNLTFSTPLPALIHGLADMLGKGSAKEVKETLSTTGIFADTSFNAYRDMYNFKRGFISKATGSQKLGVILGKAIHHPGFNAVRDWTVVFAGAAGKHTLEDAAQAVLKGDKRAAFDLQDYGIDPADVIKQGGKLTDEQMERGIYKFVDRHVFLNTKLNRSYLSQANPWTRTAFMFHNYVSAEGRLLSHELYKTYKLKSPALVVQNLVALGIIFPAAGWTVMQAERMARGEWGDKRQKESTNPVINTAMNFIDYYAHAAGFGVATSYVRGALRHQLAQSIVGPIGNVAFGDLQDAASVLHAYAHGKPTKSAWEQVARDLLEQSLPDNIGKIITHRELPTKREIKERGESNILLRLQDLHGLKSLKKLQ